MCSEMTKRNIRTELHRFERLKPHIYNVNRPTGNLHSRMYSCTPTHTHTHIHIRSDGSGVFVQIGRSRLPVYFRRDSALTEPFVRLRYFLQLCGRLFRFITDNIIYVPSAVDEYVFR
jgi:hypothetical protein